MLPAYGLHLFGKKRIFIGRAGAGGRPAHRPRRPAACGADTACEEMKETLFIHLTQLFMKHFILWGLTLAAVVLGGCSDDYDDTELRTGLNDLRDRVAKLETQLTKLNGEITTIDALVRKLESGEGRAGHGRQKLHDLLFGRHESGDCQRPGRRRGQGCSGDRREGGGRRLLLGADDRRKDDDPRSRRAETTRDGRSYPPPAVGRRRGLLGGEL